MRAGGTVEYLFLNVSEASIKHASAERPLSVLRMCERISAVRPLRESRDITSVRTKNH